MAHLERVIHAAVAICSAHLDMPPLTPAVWPGLACLDPGMGALGLVASFGDLAVHRGNQGRSTSHE